MSKTNAAVQLGIAGKALFHSRHADQDDANASAVKYVADKFKACDGQPLGFIEDEQFNMYFTFPIVPSDMAVEVIVDAIIDSAYAINEGFFQIAQGAHHGRRVKDCTRPLQCFEYPFAHKTTSAFYILDKGAS